MRLAIVVILTLFTSSVLAETPGKVLHPVQTQVMKTNLGSNDWGLSNITRDGTGNVLVTVWDPRGNPSDRPLLMFDNKGMLRSMFPASREALHLAWYEDFDEPTALTSDGEIARLASAQKMLTLTLFSADGKIKSRTQLDPPAFFPNQLVVFRDGGLLVTGLQNSHSRRELGLYKSFTAIYDKNGHLVKRLILPGDAEVDAAAELGDARYSVEPTRGNFSISGGKSLLGQDGNAYIMRRTSPATVYVVSSSGDLVRTLKIEPPEIGQMPGNMQIDGHRIAIDYRKPCPGAPCEDENFVVADAVTGETLATYSDDVKGDGTLAGYSASPERFTFLNFTDDNKLTLVETAVK